MSLSLAPYLPLIRALCADCGVRQLELFGSATRNDFDPNTSDADFFVEFHDLGWQGAFKRYMRLKLGLEDILGRPVDLVELVEIKNQYFMRVANQSREPVYSGLVAETFA